ncbi:MAG: hypothetical protein C0518_08190 [Opitutus sp.]|nr:hypothetical protein [Opitutus sp.]
MKSLVRLLSLVAALSLGAFAFASDKKAESCKDCKDASACCQDAKESCCKAAKKAEKAPEKK